MCEMLKCTPAILVWLLACLNCRNGPCNAFLMSTTFTPVVDPVSESILCATDPPSAIFSLTDVSVGVPVGVPESVICGFSCTGYENCSSYNYRKLPASSAQCELFNYSFKTCIVSSNSLCQHYQVQLGQWTKFLGTS
jgi:hypothetical protein